ncbi:hypothetical protein B0H19DRAFT_713469 [Mycena capillaripes]|nr:hypothetical protein B0H19DRAFT_713469 [Mycena capillaripes]
MLAIPPELLDIILSYLENDDLRILVLVSRAFRQLSLLCLFSRYNISMSHIRSGEVCFPEGAYFLIPAIYRIHSIKKLTILPTNLSRRKVSLCTLHRILRAMPQIPDVVICGPAYVKRSPEVAELMATLSRSGADPVVAVGMGIVQVSKPQASPPIRWVGVPAVPLESLECTARTVRSVIIFCIPFLVLCIITMIINVYRIFCWLYRRSLGSPWDQAARITTDMKGAGGDMMRIQTVSRPGSPQFTLVTFSPQRVIILAIDRPHGLAPTQSTALLAALDLPNLISLTVGTGCDLNLPALLAFVGRHHSLYKLMLSPGTIDPTSLAQDPDVRAHPGRITFLRAPAAYIPHILPTERCVESLVITSASNASALSIALAAVAALPHEDTHLRELTLDMTRPSPMSKALPWRRDPDVESASALHGVVHLTLVVQFKYRAADTRDLPRWLERFPQLQRLDFYRDSVPVKERTALAQAVAQTRMGSSETAWVGVQFHD